ncbi:MAG: NADH-quinone oxidoreductase subunit C [Candidatus Zixiibacteriota bacterium]
MKTIAEKITKFLGEKIDIHIETMGNRIYISVAIDDLIELMSLVKNELNCEFSAASGFAESDGFVLVYMLFNNEKSYMANIRTTLKDGKAIFPSIKEIYPEANWAEKELANRYNIEFKDSQNKTSEKNENDGIIDVYASVLDLDVESII